MDYTMIETFLTVAATKSLSNTAEMMFVSQSTITYRIKSLEDELGVKLIERSRGRKNISLTSKGEEFLNLAKRWNSIFHETETWKEKKSTHVLKIGAVDSLNTVTLPALYKIALEQDEYLRIQVSTHWTVTIYQMIENHELDIGFVLWSLPYNNINKKLLYTEEMVLISPDKSQLPDTVDILNLDPEKEVYMYHGPEFQAWHDSLWFDLGIQKSTVDTVSLLQHFMTSTNFWSIVPTSVAKSLINNHIKVSTIKNKPPNRKCYLLTSKYPSQSKKGAINLFSDLTVQTFR